MECSLQDSGLLDSVKIGDRTTERYVYNASTMLNSEGKKLDHVDVVFHPTLSSKVNAPILLKPITLKVGGCDIFAGVIRVSTPGENFYSCQLAVDLYCFMGKWSERSLVDSYRRYVNDL